MKKFFGEFQQFIQRGNVIDLAVGVIIGAAFQAIIKSLTDDILSPAIGLVAKTDFSEMVWTIRGVDIRYGAFVTAVINFLIMAFVVFLIVKVINKVSELARKKEEAAEEIVEEITTKECPYCLSEIAIGATRCPHCTSEISDKE